MPTMDFHSGLASAGLGPGRIGPGDCAERIVAKREATARNANLRKRKLTGAPGFFFEGEALDEVIADMIAEAGRIGNADGAVGTNSHFRLDDVFGPIALAGGDVARECVAGKRGNG